MDTDKIVEESGKTIRKLSNTPILIAFLAVMIITPYFGFKVVSDLLDKIQLSIEVTSKIEADFAQIKEQNQLLIQYLYSQRSTCR